MHFFLNIFANGFSSLAEARTDINMKTGYNCLKFSEENIRPTHFIELYDPGDRDN